MNLKILIRFEAGSFDYTRKALLKIHKELLQQLESLGGNKPLQKLIEIMHKKIVDDEFHDRSHTGLVPSPLVGLDLVMNKMSGNEEP